MGFGTQECGRKEGWRFDPAFTLLCLLSPYGVAPVARLAPLAPLWPLWPIWPHGIQHWSALGLGRGGHAERNRKHQQPTPDRQTIGM